MAERRKVRSGTGGRTSTRSRAPADRDEQEMLEAESEALEEEELLDADEPGEADDEIVDADEPEAADEDEMLDADEPEAADRMNPGTTGSGGRPSADGKTMTAGEAAKAALREIAALTDEDSQRASPGWSARKTAGPSASNSSRTTGFPRRPTSWRPTKRRSTRTESCCPTEGSDGTPAAAVIMRNSEMTQGSLALARHSGLQPRPQLSGPQSANLGDILERVLDKGIVIAGDIRVNLLDIELLTIKLRLVIASLDTASQVGINWWQADPWLSAERGRAANRPRPAGARGGEPPAAQPGEGPGGESTDDG